MGGCATPGRHSTRCRSCRLPRALMLNGFAVQEFRLVYNNEGYAWAHIELPRPGVAILDEAESPLRRYVSTFATRWESEYDRGGTATRWGAGRVTAPIA